MRIALIAAVAENSVIGRDNTLPWHLPEDLRHFKRITLGKPLVMGRRTHESIGRPLPGRTNIVITSRRDWHPADITIAHSLADAIALAEPIAAANGADEIMVIGGEQLYRQTLAIADRIYLTQVAIAVEGDAFFPVIVRTQWRETDREEGLSPASGLGYQFVVFDRCAS
ncbi:MAG: dihydrofolate reductase [Porticoccaceae bacterium]